MSGLPPISRPSCWAVRVVCWAALLYVYFAVYLRPAYAPFDFLLLNVFLAYVPIELALHLDARARPPVFWTLFAAWLLFYPNAPYVFTDLFHLAKYEPYILRENGARTGLLRPDLSMWLMFANLGASALLCLLFGVASLQHVVRELARRLGHDGWRTRVSLVLGLTALASTGIYIGRFLRLHSADLLLRPCYAAGQLVGVWNADAALFVAIMTAFQMAVWVLVVFTGGLARPLPGGGARNGRTNG